MIYFLICSLRMITDPARIAKAVMKPTNPYGYEKPDITAAVITIKENHTAVTAATKIEAFIIFLITFSFTRERESATRSLDCC